MIEVLCTFLGTFLGAILAFLFNAMNEKKKEFNYQKSVL